MVVIIILLAICFIVLMICWDKLIEDEESKCKYAFILTTTSFFVGSIITTLLTSSYKTPRAIDVYRGNTKLEITKKVVNDSIIQCDSIVVFKNNKE